MVHFLTNSIWKRRGNRICSGSVPHHMSFQTRMLLFEHGIRENRDVDSMMEALTLFIAFVMLHYTPVEFFLPSTVCVVSLSCVCCLCHHSIDNQLRFLDATTTLLREKCFELSTYPPQDFLHSL